MHVTAGLSGHPPSRAPIRTDGRPSPCRMLAADGRHRNPGRCVLRTRAVRRPVHPGSASRACVRHTHSAGTPIPSA